MISKGLICLALLAFVAAACRCDQNEPTNWSGEMESDGFMNSVAFKPNAELKLLSELGQALEDQLYKYKEINTVLLELLNAYTPARGSSSFAGEKKLRAKRPTIVPTRG